MHGNVAVALLGLEQWEEVRWRLWSARHVALCAV